MPIKRERFYSDQNDNHYNILGVNRMGKQRSIIKEENFEEQTHEPSEKSVTVNYAGVEYMQQPFSSTN